MFSSGSCSAASSGLSGTSFSSTPQNTWHQPRHSLSNTNQLWGLLWGTLVFGELHGRSHSVYAQVIGGSLLMMAGVAAIAFSSASSSEQTCWKQAAHRESHRYNVERDYVEARMDGRQAASEAKPSRTAIDWLLVAAVTAIFVYLGATPASRKSHSTGHRL